MSARNTPRGKQGRMDARLHFIAQCLNQKLTSDADKANTWFIAHEGHTMSTDAALAEFKEWLK